MAGHKRSPWEKLLLAYQFLDKLELDFRDVYPDMDSPMQGGYEAALRSMFEDKYKK